jgi:transcriptional regulator with XRE-family HTH domain
VVVQAEQLADFLRTRRLRLVPSDVGLTAGGPRRTPGLRREEVAVLANVGVSWLTRLEQGRANRVSAEVLTGLADALRLSGPERTHLFALAGLRPPPPVVGGQASDPSQRILVDGLAPNPAYVLDHGWDLVCWNRAEMALFPVLADLDGPANLLRLTLETPVLRTFMTDWDEEVGRLTRQFRLHLTQHPSPAGDALAGELRAGHPEFAAAWSRHDVAEFAPRVRRFHHDTAGELSFHHHRMLLPDHPGWSVVVYTPDPDDGTAHRFAALLG